MRKTERKDSERNYTTLKNGNNMVYSKKGDPKLAPVPARTTTKTSKNGNVPTTMFSVHKIFPTFTNFFLTAGFFEWWGHGVQLTGEGP